MPLMFMYYICLNTCNNRLARRDTRNVVLFDALCRPPLLLASIQVIPVTFTLSKNMSPVDSAATRSTFSQSMQLLNFTYIIYQSNADSRLYAAAHSEAQQKHESIESSSVDPHVVEPPPPSVVWYCYFSRKRIYICTFQLISVSWRH